MAFSSLSAGQGSGADASGGMALPGGNKAMPGEPPMASGRGGMDEGKEGQSDHSVSLEQSLSTMHGIVPTLQ